MAARAFVATVCVFLLSGADAEEDLKLLQGKWSMVAFENEGSKLPNWVIKDNTLTIKGSKWVMLFDSVGIEWKASFKLDPSASPRTIDYTETATGDVEGRRVKGIYKIEGDTLTICRARGDGKGPRPTRISGKDRGVVLMVWKRIKK
jgi:uncharacterized protein (TIGR03067 family)